MLRFYQEYAETQSPADDLYLARHLATFKFDWRSVSSETGLDKFGSVLHDLFYGI